MNKLNIILFLGFLIIVHENAFAEKKEAKGSLSIRVIGLAHNRGGVVANLFQEGSDIMKIETAYQKEKAIIEDHEATLIFQDLHQGKYAVSVFHDENSDGDLNHNVFNFPSEPMGFSNRFKFGIFSGLPSFEKLQFSFVPETSNSIVIEVE